MKTPPIDPRAARDIRSQVAKIHRGLGSTRVPIDLREVRELLKLDKKFYSSTDTGELAEIGSKIKIGAKQLLLRPSLLLDVVRKAGLRALWVPDRKRILIDKDLPELKKRHAEAHEITHGVTPHHAIYLLGDDEATLRHSCYEKIEAEANFGSGQLLFPEELFQSHARDLPLSIATIQRLAKEFGNTRTMTLWRLVEEAHGGAPVFGVISIHPGRAHHSVAEADRCPYFIESPAFRQEFSSITEAQVFAEMRKYCSRASGGPLGEADVVLADDNGVRHRFHLETFFNRHQALTLGTHVAKVSRIVAVG